MKRSALAHDRDFRSWTRSPHSRFILSPVQPTWLQLLKIPRRAVGDGRKRHRVPKSTFNFEILLAGNKPHSNQLLCARCRPRRMAGYADAESDFSDDDLDLLPPNALAELESHAIRCTQAAHTQTRRAVPPSSDYGDNFEDEDLDDAVVIDEARSAPAIVPNLHRNLSQPSQREKFPHQPYGTTSIASRQRPDGYLHQPARDNLPSPAAMPRKVPMAARQGSQTGGTDEAAALRRQLEEVCWFLSLLKHPCGSTNCSIRCAKNWPPSSKTTMPELAR
jgi:hypothetical protein